MLVPILVPNRIDEYRLYNRYWFYNCTAGTAFGTKFVPSTGTEYRLHGGTPSTGNMNLFVAEESRDSRYMWQSLQI